MKNIVAIIGEYTNTNWETKKNYLTIWRVIEKDWKQSIKIDSIPVWWNWWAGIYENEKKDNKWNTDDLPF